MTELFLSAFVMLFVVMDPIGCAPIYASMTRDASWAQRRDMAVRAVVIATVILLVFALFGSACSTFSASASTVSASRAASCCS